MMAQPETTNDIGPILVEETAYLGPEASFSHQAAVEALPETRPVPLPSFNAILTSLQQSAKASSRSISFAVLPVENSTNGSVVQALDLLAQCRLDPHSSAYPDVEVVDEHYLEVHHCLFVPKVWAEQKLTQDELAFLKSEPEKLAAEKLEEILAKLNIKTLYTHPQVWGQCNRILSSLLPPGLVERVDMSSTSAAAGYVASHSSNIQDGGAESGIAAISSSLAGAKHEKSLICLARNIEDEPGANTTRFLILQNQNRHRQKPIPPGLPETNMQVKSLWAFTISHHLPGSLAQALAIFARHGFNLSAIQSRPKPRAGGNDGTSSQNLKDNQLISSWKYVFFVECLHFRSGCASAHNDKNLQNLLHDLQSVTEQLSLLGNWVNRLAFEVG